MRKGTGQLLGKALKRLGQPVTRRYILPGEANEAVAEAKQRTASLPRGTRALYRKDGKVLLAGQRDRLLIQAVRDRVDLSGIHLVRTNLRDRNLDMAKMDGADLRLSDLSSTRMNSAHLTDADLRRVRLSKFYARGLEAAKSDFSEARLFKAVFEGSNLTASSFAGARVIRSNLSTCQLAGADFSGAVLKGSNLRDSCLISAGFDGSTVKGGNFSSADLREIDFSTCSFGKHRYYDDFGHYTVDRINLCGADLRGSIFRADANFSSMNLRNAKLDDIVLLDSYGEPITGACLQNDGTIVYSEVMDVPKLARENPRIPGIS
ncbi:MAG: hypothetical protein Alpg2KO_22400 [Alphaproteobacteria bacterium]